MREGGTVSAGSLSGCDPGVVSVLLSPSELVLITALGLGTVLIAGGVPAASLRGGSLRMQIRQLTGPCECEALDNHLIYL